MRTLRMVALQDSVPFSRMLEQLDELELRPRDQWSPRAEVQHRSIERQIVERVLAKDAPAGAAISCAVEVEVQARGSEQRAMLSALEPGGARLDLEGDWAPGTVLKLVTAETQIGVSVVGATEGGVRIAFLRPRTASAEERIYVFVRAALRHRTS